MTDTVVVVNPASGGGSTGRNWVGLRPHLEAARPGHAEAFTTGPGHATELVREAIRSGAREIVVVGGDGTLNEAVNGFFEPDPELGIQARLVAADVTLVPVRRGTGGDFARFFGLKGRGAPAFAHLGDRSTRALDLGLCELIDHDGNRRRRAFVNVASFGLSGLVDEKVNASSKSLGTLAFVWGAASALLAYRRVPVRVRVDGTVLHEGPLLLGAVANAAYFGGGMRIAPDADPGDGLLDVVLLLEAGPGEVVRAPQVFTGRHTAWRSARVGRGAVVEAEPLDGRCLVDLDGEQPGVLGARFTVMPGGARVRA